jgi:hypothetical protein
MKRWLSLTLVCCVLLCLFLSLLQAVGWNHGLQIVGLRPDFDQGKEPDLRRHSLGCQKHEIRSGSHWISCVSGTPMCVDYAGNLGPPGPETHGPPEPIGLGASCWSSGLPATPTNTSSTLFSANLLPQATNFQESEFHNSL